ncbi:MAG: DUF2175 family protein [Nitrososphaerales archaeon]
MASKWNCAICSKQIMWSELFTFYSKGAAHFLCFKDVAVQTKKEGVPVDALLNILETELRMIVSYKKHLSETTNEDLKKVLDENEKDAEKHAALLTKLIDRMALQK